MPGDAMLTAARRSSGWTTFGLIQVSAKKPSTTLGMEARISMIGLRTLRTRGVAYSDR